MATYRLRFTPKTFAFLWGIPIGFILIVAIGYGLATAAGDTPHVGPWWTWLLAVTLIAGYNLRIVREIRVSPEGQVEVRCPFRRREFSAMDTLYLSPAFSKDFLELGFKGGKYILIESMDNLDGLEEELHRLNSSFQGRGWRDA